MKLYLRYVVLHLESILSYKLSFILTTIGQFLVSFNVFLGVYFMFQRFNVVKGYSFAEVLLCFAILLLSYSIAECFFRGFDQFSSIISNGEFDRMLVRPQPIILQILGTKIEFSRFGRMSQGVLMFSYAILTIDMTWTQLKVVTVILMLLGGVVLFASIYLIYACLCFYTIEGLEFMNIFTDGAREYGRYPLDVYGKNVLKFTTFLVPFALIQYYPFLYLIDATTKTWYVLLPLVATSFAVPSYLFWRFSLRYYKSTGS